MTELSEIMTLYKCIRDTSGWYIDFSCPEETRFLYIIEKAKSRAEERLSNITFLHLWRRYLQWDKTDKILPAESWHYDTFLNWLVFEFGKGVLHSEEEMLYNEACNLTFKFI